MDRYIRVKLCESRAERKGKQIKIINEFMFVFF